MLCPFACMDDLRARLARLRPSPIKVHRNLDVLGSDLGGAMRRWMGMRISKMLDSNKRNNCEARPAPNRVERLTRRQPLALRHSNPNCPFWTRGTAFGFLTAAATISANIKYNLSTAATPKSVWQPKTDDNTSDKKQFRRE
jgi:hypothetical protein